MSSQDDPYGDPTYAEQCAKAWGSVVVDIGKAGQINGASNLDSWPRGLRLLTELRSPGPDVP